MDVEVRFYKAFDIDIISLEAAGYPVKEMTETALNAYANGNPVHFLIDVPISSDFNSLKTFHTRLKIADSDVRTIHMLKNIKNRYRNAFCKTILRDALIQQNLTVFFANGSENVLYPLKDISLAGKGINSMDNVILLSTIQKKEGERPLKLSEMGGFGVSSRKEISVQPLPVAPVVSHAMPAPSVEVAPLTAPSYVMPTIAPQMISRAEIPTVSAVVQEPVPVANTEPLEDKNAYGNVENTEVASNPVQKAEPEEKNAMLNINTEETDALMAQFDAL